MITNKINGKRYIGQTVRSLSSRWSSHKSGRSRCLAIKSAIDKYGAENFTVESIFNAESLEELNKKEEEFINNFNTLAPNGYNLKTGGSAPKFSEESKEKMSASRKKYKQSEETIKKQAAARSGSRNVNFGKKFSAEHRRKLSISHLGNKSALKAKVL